MATDGINDNLPVAFLVVGVWCVLSLIILYGVVARRKQWTGLPGAGEVS
ncbi:MAG: hypothetical protein IIB28_07250 [Chloroflexi bacterium]|nr:hypothetical protein [Chloroflexota bacterium]MCH8102933.1 hypothetical protein [Chloroflexota bacterium]